MQPKEKAEELITKFRPLVTTWDCYWDAERDENLIIADAKQCALIAIDEILKIENNNGYHFDGTNVTSISYWQEVKQEIEKL